MATMSYQIKFKIIDKLPLKLVHGMFNTLIPSLKIKQYEFRHHELVSGSHNVTASC